MTSRFSSAREGFVFTSATTAPRGLSRNARWALKQIDITQKVKIAAKQQSEGGIAVRGIEGQQIAGFTVHVPLGLRKELSHAVTARLGSIRADSDPLVRESRRLYNETNGFGTRSRREEVNTFEGSNARGGGGINSGEEAPPQATHRPPQPRIHYDDVDSNTGDSVVQARFDQWVQEAIVNYCPVAVQSIRVTELYVMLRKVVPDFTVDTHCDGLPLSALCGNCVYLMADGGRLHFMRIIRPTGRHGGVDGRGRNVGGGGNGHGLNATDGGTQKDNSQGSLNRGPNSHYDKTFRRPEEERYTTEDDEADRVNKRKGASNNFNSHASNNNDVEDPFVSFANATRHLDPDSVKRAMLKQQLGSVAEDSAAAHNNDAIKRSSNIEQRRARGLPGVYVEEEGSEAFFGGSKRAEDSVYDALDDEEERAILRALKGDTRQVEALQQRFAAERAAKEETEEGEDFVANDDNAVAGSGDEEDAADGPLYSEGVLSAEAIINATRREAVADIHAEDKVARKRQNTAYVPNLNIFDIDEDGTSLNQNLKRLAQELSSRQQYGTSSSQSGQLQHASSSSSPSSPAAISTRGSLSHVGMDGELKPNPTTAGVPSPTKSSESLLSDDDDVSITLLYPEGSDGMTPAGRQQHARNAIRVNNEGERSRSEWETARANLNNRKGRDIGWRDPANTAAMQSSLAAMSAAAAAEEEAMQRFYGEFVGPTDNNKKKSEDMNISSHGDSAVKAETSANQVASEDENVEALDVDGDEDEDLEDQFTRGTSEAGAGTEPLRPLADLFNAANPLYKTPDASASDSSTGASSSPPSVKVVLDDDGYATTVSMPAPDTALSTKLAAEAAMTLKARSIALKVQQERERAVKEAMEKERALLKARQEAEERVAQEAAAFDCLMMDEDEGAALPTPTPSSIPSDASTGSKASPSKEDMAAFFSSRIKQDVPLVDLNTDNDNKKLFGKAGQQSKKDDLPHDCRASPQQQQQQETDSFSSSPTSTYPPPPKTRPRDTYFENNFFKPEPRPEPGTVSVTNPRLRPLPRGYEGMVDEDADDGTEGVDHATDATRRPARSPFRGMTLADYEAAMQRDVLRSQGVLDDEDDENGGEEDRHHADNDESARHREEYQDYTASNNDATQRKHPSSRQPRRSAYDDDEDEDAYLASLDDDADHDDAQTEEDASASASSPTLERLHRRKASRSYDDGGLGAGDDSRGSGEEEGKESKNSRDDEPRAMDAAEAEAYYRAQREQKAKAAATKRNERYLNEADDEIFADPEAALIDGRAMTIGLAKYNYRQAEAKDGVRKGPEFWKYRTKDTFKPGSYVTELKEKRREKLERRQSLF